MGKIKIAIIDDTHTNLTSIKRVLSLYGFSSMTYSSVDSFFSNKPKIDLILTDHNMPDKNGLDLIKKSRQKSSIYKDTPIIMISATIDLQVEIDALELGANDFISKPFNPKVLVARINNQLRQR